MARPLGPLQLVAIDFRPLGHTHGLASAWMCPIVQSWNPLASLTRETYM